MDRLMQATQALAVRGELRGARALGAAALLGLLVAAAAWLVYQTGGIRYVFSHSVYLPVVLAAFLFGAPGGILAGIAGGLALGPFMPIDTGTGEMQTTLNWTYRLAFLVLIGGVTGMLVSLLRRHIRHVQWLSLHDPETGIPNSRALFDEVRRVVHATPDGGRFAVVVVDLCNYLDITSTLGPEMGARLSGAVAQRLQHLVGFSTPVCSVHTQRLGFVLAGPDAVDIDAICTALQEAHIVDGLTIYVDTAVGSAEFPVHGTSPDELLQKSIIAMHSAVQRGTTHLPYDISADRTSRGNLELLGELPQALKDGHVTLFYQPKVDISTGVITGAEALLRWEHAAKGWVSPGAFLPYVENSAMIHTLTTWVFQRVVEQLAAWRASGLELQIAINLSMRNLQEPAVLASIERLLEDGSIPNALIEFEITESALLLDPRLAAKLFERWRAYGVTVAVDDFGTGNASLAYVKDLPVDVLKIDQVFIKSLQNSRRDQAIVHAAIALARDLGLKTVAEGVENLDVLAHLRDRACDYAQGYAIQKPLPPAELDAWFMQNGHGFTVRRAASA